MQSCAGGKGGLEWQGSSRFRVTFMFRGPVLRHCAVGMQHLPQWQIPRCPAGGCQFAVVCSNAGRSAHGRVQKPPQPLWGWGWRIQGKGRRRVWLGQPSSQGSPTVSAKGRPKKTVSLDRLGAEVPKQNFGCQPQTLEGEEGGSRGGGGVLPPPPVYGRPNKSLGRGGAGVTSPKRPRPQRRRMNLVVWLQRS